MNNIYIPKFRPIIKYPVLGIIFYILYWTISTFYQWVYTESTNNAYIETDISIFSPEVSGVINEVLVQENTLVRKGQIIARLKREDILSAYQKSEALTLQAQREVEMIEQNIKLNKINQLKLQESLEFAEATYKFTSIDYDRITELSKDNYASKKVRDKTEIDFEKTKNDLSQSELNIKTNNEELALLEIKRLSAISKLNATLEEQEIAARSLENTDLKAPINGTIGNSSLKIGNYVRTGMNLFSIIPTHDLYIKANFKETQIDKFRPNMQVKIYLDARKDLEFTGIIRSISPATGSKFSLLPPANATGNFTKIVQRVPITIDFKIPDQFKDTLNIIPGMSVTVKVRTDQTLP